MRTVQPRSASQTLAFSRRSMQPGAMNGIWSMQTGSQRFHRSKGQLLAVKSHREKSCRQEGVQGVRCEQGHTRGNGGVLGGGFWGVRWGSEWLGLGVHCTPPLWIAATHHPPLHHCHEMCVRPTCATRAVAWAAQWAVERQLQLTSAHRETAVELEEVGVGSGLGHVPLHGALGVSRGALLLYCSQT